MSDRRTQFAKYACARDRILDVLVVAGKAVREAGDPESPTGRFALVCVADTQLSDVMAGFGHFAEGDGFNRDELVGNFIVTYTADGFVFVGEFQKLHQAEDEFEQLEKKFAKWGAAVAAEDIACAAEYEAAAGLDDESDVRLCDCADDDPNCRH